MFILEKPYISDHLLDYAAGHAVPVLRTAFTEMLAQRAPLHLVNDEKFVAGLRAGRRLYTSSENALDWVYTHYPNSKLTRCCDIMKNKAALRRLLAARYPDFFFKEIPAHMLADTNPATLCFPCVIKPSTGFFSLGVRTIARAEDWPDAIAVIMAELQACTTLFPASVLDSQVFLVEEYINGEEFAVDMYYDGQGEPVILNIFHHSFASTEDVSDRLYCTGKAIISAHLAPFTCFFRDINTTLQVQDFPAHVELRIDKGRIIPIEFNPLRCAGMCCTDLAHYAYGFDTYDYYLHDLRPNFNEILRDRGDWTYSMLILDKRPGLPEHTHFDFDALAASVQHVLDMRPMLDPTLPLFGIMFTRTDAAHATQLDALLQSDLSEFLLPVRT